MGTVREFDQFVERVAKDATHYLGASATLTVTATSVIAIAGQAEPIMASFSMVAVGEKGEFTYAVCEGVPSITANKYDQPRLISRPAKFKPRRTAHSGSRAWELD